MLKHSVPMLFAGIALAVFLVLPAPAVAEEADDRDGYTLESVTVTAQKREENVQEVPASIGVLDDVTLQEERSYELLDLDKTIPNLYMATSGGSTTYSFVGIRGRINSGVDVDPTVTVMVDGVPFDDYYTLSANLLFDIERVEVLRGPQSTMYGLNSTAGVINIITKKPGDTLHYGFNAEGSAGPDSAGSYNLSGSLSGPLVENTLSAGVSFMGQNNGGYVENLNTGDLYNNDTKYAGRGSLVWTPSDAWDITLGLGYTDLDADSGCIYLPTDDAAAALVGMDEQEDWKTNINREGFSEIQNLNTHLTVNYDAGSLEVVSVSSYNNSQQEFLFDADYSTAATGYFAESDDELESFSQELRLQSSEDNNSHLEWLVGYFYHQFLRNKEFFLTFEAAPDVVYTYTDSKFKGSSHAVFGQVTYRLLERKLGLTLGARQEWTKRELADRLDYLPDMEHTDSQFLPKFAVDYRVTPEAMVYASVAEGWRSGGFYNRSMLTSDPDTISFDKETSWTYELGAKTQFLDNRLLLNLALFHTIYSDFQDLYRLSPTQAYLKNADEVTMTGLELDAQAQLLDNLLLTVGFGYVAGEYQDFEDETGTYSGNTVICSPDWDLNVALKYSFLDNFYVRPEIQGVGAIYWDRLNQEKQDPYLLFNLRAGLAKDEWEIYVFGENLTNEYKFVTADDVIGNGEYYGVPIKPLQIGMGISCRF